MISLLVFFYLEQLSIILQGSHTSQAYSCLVLWWPAWAAWWSLLRWTWLAAIQAGMVNIFPWQAMS